MIISEQCPGLHFFPGLPLIVADAKLIFIMCPICASELTRSISTARRAFFRCGSCGFAWASEGSRPDEASARARYALHRNNPDDPGYVAFLSGIIDRALDVPTARARTVVDWGSGPNPVCSDLLRSRGLDVSQWDPLFASDAMPPAGAFDVALCIEVAEHFSDPVKDFRAFASRVKPGGRAVLHTHQAPDSDDDFLRWWYIEDPTHVSFYTETSLRLLARIASLSVEAMEGGRLAFFRRPKPVLVAGGANVDIEGQPFSALVAGDSNPGQIRSAPGGTARNIAEDLARLGLAVEFVSAVGKDAAGADLSARTASSGVGISGVESIDGQTTSCYLSILDEEGDMSVAVSSMDIYEQFDSARALAAADRAALSARISSVEDSASVPFSALVLDGNLPPETAEALINRFPGIPVWFDPVSTTKARRFASYRGGDLLSRLSCAKPNGIEALSMIEELDIDLAYHKKSEQKKLDIDESSTSAAHALRSAGIDVIYVSLGERGVLCASSSRVVRVIPPVVPLVSATGAGDAFLAGALRGSLLGQEVSEAAAAGCVASSVALASQAACPLELDALRLEIQLSRWRISGAIAWKDEQL